jgi:hypothetical protein
MAAELIIRNPIDYSYFERKYIPSAAIVKRN